MKKVIAQLSETKPKSIFKLKFQNQTEKNSCLSLSGHSCSFDVLDKRFSIADKGFFVLTYRPKKSFMTSFYRNQEYLELRDTQLGG